MKRFIILSVVILSFFILTDKAFPIGEEMTITTYYPSPYGVYSTLRLYPNASEPVACDSTTQGTLYYDSNSTTGWLCKETDPGTYEWVDIAPYCTDTGAHTLIPGTYNVTVPRGCHGVSLTLIGGGGGGGGGIWTPAAGYKGQDGGDGGLWTGVFEVTPGDDITIVAGAAGIGGGSGSWNWLLPFPANIPIFPTAGGDGGDSSFGTSFGTMATAFGGEGGNGASLFDFFPDPASDGGVDPTSQAVDPSLPTGGDGGVGGFAAENGENGGGGRVIYKFTAYAE